ncbi:hypothetical protein DFH08DRAFT_1013666 [Mycena albidolilacea]|uniref:Uncharacterized protein n=1 Tax=Mycena albidolilacea TaxID=1033008 RepID=A0AAD6ZUJ0_9AGAR|nr:hypothetical protein DFH08DRAFT_1013666 [Mycena albidolilacea]
MFHKLRILTAFFTFLVLGQGAVAVPQSSDIVCGRPTVSFAPFCNLESFVLTTLNSGSAMPTPSLLCVYEIDAPLVNIYEILAKRRFDYPLPDLEHLSWNGYSADIPLHFINVILGPGITSVDFGTPFDRHCPMLATLGQTHPGLRSVLHSCIPPRLESLDVRIVDCETLEYLGRLPSLKKLRTIIPDPIPLPGVVARSMFSNIRELRPEQQDPGGGEITPIIAFLRACNNPPLRSFEAPYVIEWNLEQVEELYQVLAGHILHNHLDMLQLEFLETDPPVIPPHPGRFFRHLFSFTRLTVIEIQVPSGYDLEDAIVAEMAHAWPNLEEFGLRSRSNCQPRCTLLSLHAFSRHCPRL